MKRIKRGGIILSLILAITFMDIEAYAAPKKMSDGGTFDAAFYAQTYPDVASAVGTDEAALYNHYLNYGKAEGRKPYADAAAQPAASTGSVAQASGSVAEKIAALRASYPEGSTWTDSSSYTTQSTYPNMRSTASACQGFCYLAQDMIFGKKAYKRHKTGISNYVRKQVGSGKSYTMVQGNSTFIPTRNSYSSNDPEWAQVMAARDDCMWIPVYSDRTRIYPGNDPTINAEFEKIYNSLQVGDMICDANHAAIVLSKDNSGVTVVEGNVVINNAPGAVKWGRRISKETMRVALYDVYSCLW